MITHKYNYNLSIWFKLNKNLLITVCLLFIYFFIFTIVLNDLNMLLYIFPLALFIALIRLTWDHSNQILSSVIFFLTLFLAISIFNSSFRTKNQRELSLLYNRYQMKRIHDAPEMKISNLDSHLNVKNSYNFFFVETNYQRVELSTKELCAIESAAKNNPNAQVHILSIRARMGNFSFLLHKYPNLLYQKFMPFKLFNNSPLMDWYLRGDVFRSKYMISHLTDAARFTLLWKYGGVYSDLDTITLKNFQNLIKISGTGYLYEEGHSLGAGVLLFHAKNLFLEYIINKLALEYDPSVWGAAGPLMLISSIKEYCQSDDIFKSLAIEPLNSFESGTTRNQNILEKLFSEINSSVDKSASTRLVGNKECNNIKIFPERYFYPYHYRTNLVDLFKPNAFLDIRKLIDTYSLHLYGKFSFKYSVKPGDLSVYEYLASLHCPLVYEHVKVNNLVFE